MILLVLIVCGCSNNSTPELSCENGVLDGDKCKIVETAQPILKCADGYVADEKNGKCTNTITIAAKQVSTCPTGYEIGNDNWCFSEERFPMIVKKTCESANIKEGDTFSSTFEKDGKCFEKICVKISKDGKVCEEFKETEIAYKEENVCPYDNMRKEDDMCRKKKWMLKDISCEIGTLDGKNCIIEDVVEKEKECTEGYSLNKDNLCEKISYEVPIVN